MAIGLLHQTEAAGDDPVPRVRDLQVFLRSLVIRCCDTSAQVEPHALATLARERVKKAVFELLVRKGGRYRAGALLCPLTPTRIKCHTTALRFCPLLNAHSVVMAMQCLGSLRTFLKHIVF